MLDGICALIFFGFFGFVIYATVLVPRAQRAAQPAHVPEAPPPRKPGPVGLYCEICREHAGVVSTEEYQRLESPVYCSSCKFVIERYKARA